ncbi:unnamed protein product [Trichobilharzia szidati]|nr:unnamed protein product [Trichobilharzia szidati]
MASVDLLINQLTDPRIVSGENAKITEKELIIMMKHIVDIFLEEPVCIDLKSDRPIYIIGDIFAHFQDLVNIFNALGHPDRQVYLFLGNYIDRGSRSIETITLLFAYKLKHPRNIFLLRGNHECEYVSSHYGFLDECIQRYSRRLWKSAMNTFDCLPVAAIIDDTIFCVHSGLIPCIQYSNIASKIQLRDYLGDIIRRPVAIPDNFLLTHLTWSEPLENSTGWQWNPCGLGQWYGEDVIDEFCQRFNFQQIIRSHDLFHSGYEFSANEKMLSICTAVNLMNTIKNYGAIVKLCKSPLNNIIRGTIKIIKPKISSHRNKPSKEIIIIDSATHKTQNSDNDPWEGGEETTVTNLTTTQESSSKNQSLNSNLHYNPEYIDQPLHRQNSHQNRFTLQKVL